MYPEDHGTDVASVSPTRSWWEDLAGMQALSEIVQTQRLRLAGHVLRLPDVTQTCTCSHDLDLAEEPAVDHRWPGGRHL